jgi:CRISPR/Cas system-associated protein Cas7 (RAMP superfamily)
MHYLVSFLSVYGLMELDLREIGLGGVDWIRLAQDRDRWRAVVSAVMNLRVLAPRS